MVTYRGRPILIPIGYRRRATPFHCLLLAFVACYPKVLLPASAYLPVVEMVDDRFQKHHSRVFLRENDFSLQVMRAQVEHDEEFQRPTLYKYTVDELLVNNAR